MAGATGKDSQLAREPGIFQTEEQCPVELELLIPAILRLGGLPCILLNQLSFTHAGSKGCKAASNQSL